MDRYLTTRARTETQLSRLRRTPLLLSEQKGHFRSAILFPAVTFFPAMFQRILEEHLNGLAAVRKKVERILRRILAEGKQELLISSHRR